MRVIGFRTILVFLSFAVVSCGNHVKPDCFLQVEIYHNSFENAADLSQWEGYSPLVLVSDPCPQTGEKSVRVSGGCIAPHASLVLDSPGMNLNVDIEFYGKNLLGGGSVSYFTGSRGLFWDHIEVDDTTWTLYQSENSIYWHADSTLTIWMISGGITSGAMLIDELKITISN